MIEQEKLERVNYFEPGDKFILEIGERQLDEYKIAGTDYYIKTFLLKKLIPYSPKEQTAKVIEHDASVTDTDGYKYHRSEYLCDTCKKRVIGGDKYCSHCGSKLTWGDDNE